MHPTKRSCVYRVRGLSPQCSEADLCDTLQSHMSTQEAALFHPKISIIPSCYSDGTSTALLTLDAAPTFLSELDENPLLDWPIETDDGDINLDKHFHGFTQLYQTPQDTEISADLIAVSGLDGHAYGSWRGKGPLQRMWLRDFLCKDLPQFRTLIYGYNAKLHSRGINTLQDYCAEFLEELKMIRSTPQEARRPLILLGHSFGGLVLAQTLIKTKQRDRDANLTLSSLYDSIIGMMFFATPHRGLLVDDIQSMVGEDATHPRTSLVEQIRYNSQWLAEQLSDFKNLIGARLVVNFVEMQQTRRLVADGNGSWSRSGEFVTALGPDSALLQLPDSMEIKIRADADHSSIVKFDSTFNPTYQRAVKYLRQCVEEGSRRVPKPTESSEATSGSHILHRDGVAQHGQVLVSSTLPDEEIKSSLTPGATHATFDRSVIRRVGVTVLHDPPEPIADIVFIPGGPGDPWLTWSSLIAQPERLELPKHLFWPAQFLPFDCPRARTLVWGFQCRLHHDGEEFLETASDLLNDLVASWPLTRSIIFVAHSLGGLILKEALQKAENSGLPALRDIVNYTAGVIFLGTPHRGDGDKLTFHDVVSSVIQSVVSRRTSASTRPSLVREDPALLARLDAARRSFISQKEIYDFQIKAFVEGTRDTGHAVVPRLAASFDQLDEVERVEVIKADHQSMCQFATRQGPGYRQVLATMQAWLDKIKAAELQYRDECLKSLNFVELQNREFDITTALEKTATWLFTNRDYVDWSRWDISHSDSRRGLLWLKGKPGSGKSTLMKECLRRARANALGISSSICVASYFFTTRTNVPLQKTPLGLFRTILHELVQQDRALLTAFIAEYRRKSAASPSNWRWHQEELQGFFRAAYSGKLRGVRKAMVFIDALDECDDDEGYNVARDLVYYLRDITAGHLLKVCLSSRHYPHIKIPDCPQVVVESFNHDDVVRFIQTQLSTANDARARDLAGKIAARADGVFLWVILVVKSLNIDLDNERTDAELEETLKTVPKKLEDVFASLFNNAPTRLELQKSAMIFQWVLLAAHPLSYAQLRHALTFDRNAPTRLVESQIWSHSRDCLPADPERFLTSLRFYTRGLAEIIRRSLKIPDDVSTEPGDASEVSYDASTWPYDASTWPYDASTWPYDASTLAFDRPTPSQLYDTSSDRADIFSSTPATFASLLTQQSSSLPLLTLDNDAPGWEASSFKTATDLTLKWSPVLFIHESVREYFLRGEGFPVLEGSSSSIAQRHCVLAEICAACINRDGIQLLQNPRYNAFSEAANDYPFLLYAIQYLFFHTKQAEIGGLLPNMVVEELLLPEDRLWTTWNTLDRVFFGAGGLMFPKEIPRRLPFQLLCRTQQLLSAAVFLERGVSVDAQDDSGNTALHHSALANAPEAIRFLLANGADMHKRNFLGESPLHCISACRDSTEEVLCNVFRPFLMRRDCRLSDDNNGYTPLHAAVRENNPQAVRALLQHIHPFDDPLVNSTTPNGDTALSIAARYGDMEVLSAILDAGANPSARSATGKTKGRTALHTAAWRGNARLVVVLLRAGADVNARDEHGATPLHHAHLRPSGLSLLLAAGADVTARTDAGRSPLHSAARTRRLGPFERLIEAGADPLARDDNGKTPVDIAGVEKIVANPSLHQLLVSEGIEITAAKPPGRSRVLPTNPPTNPPASKQVYSLIM